LILHLNQPGVVPDVLNRYAQTLFSLPYSAEFPNKISIVDFYCYCRGKSEPVSLMRD